MTKNAAASVRARLTNRARGTNRPFQEVLQHYGLERFLYRLAESPHGGRFVLKGALLLKAWGAPTSRPTRDIDFLGYVENQVPVVESLMREVCMTAVPPDGLIYDHASLAGRRIKEDADYQGVRITFTGFLDRARIPMQLDIGFGDVVHPKAERMEYPASLDLPSGRLLMYPRETVVAEKLEAAVHLGTLNSRMKDFFDLWLLARAFDFSASDLAAAIAGTFSNRGTTVEADPVALTARFMAAEGTQKQWAAFVKRSQLHEAPATLDELRRPLREFLLPVVDSILAGEPLQAHWRAGGPWA